MLSSCPRVLARVHNSKAGASLLNRCSLDQYWCTYNSCCVQQSCMHSTKHEFLLSCFWFKEACLDWHLHSQGTFVILSLTAWQRREQRRQQPQPPRRWKRWRQRRLRKWNECRWKYCYVAFWVTHIVSIRSHMYLCTLLQSDGSCTLAPSVVLAWIDKECITFATPWGNRSGKVWDKYLVRDSWNILFSICNLWKDFVIFTRVPQKPLAVQSAVIGPSVYWAVCAWCKIEVRFVSYW